MEAIREIQTVENGEIHLQLPEEFWGQQVEIIVLSAPHAGSRSGGLKKSLRGSLRQYARPERMPEEQQAWQTAASEKHESY
jgi:hypothetical protein